MVGMPIHHYMENSTVMCFEATMLQLQKRGIPFHRMSTVGLPDVAKARNQIVEEFLKDKRYTHLMWIDADMAWDPNAVEALIDLNVPVASCLVTKKGPPFDITMFQLMKPAKDSKFLDTYTVPFGQYPLDRPFIFPNSGIGTAFMLIAREVIEKMEQPYFCGFVNPTDKTLKGTDYYFCVQMLKHGYEIVYDPRPPVYHIGKGLFGVEDHIAYLNHIAAGGTKECPFMNGDASVVEFKKSFAGPQPSLIQDLVSAGERQRDSSLVPEALKSETSLCPSSEKGDQTKMPTKTGIDVCRSPQPEENTKLPTPPENEPTKTTSAVEP